MRITIAAILLTTAGLGTASAQSTGFQGIAGELPKITTDQVEPGPTADGLSFRIDRGRNRELEKATGVIPATQSQFYRPSILTGQRSRRTRGTGLTIFDKILDLD